GPTGGAARRGGCPRAGPGRRRGPHVGPGHRAHRDGRRLAAGRPRQGRRGRGARRRRGGPGRAPAGDRGAAAGRCPGRSARLVAADAVVREAFVTRERTATFAPRPGTAADRPGPRTRASRLVVAGAFTDTGWPATMEGAVRSGAAAAQALLPTLTGPSTRDPH